MRKVVLYHLMSLDGIAFEDGDWFTDSGPEMFANLTRVIEPQDTILLGRGTALKQQPGGDIGIHGSIELARSFLHAELIDELRLVVAPAIVGDGRRVLDNPHTTQTLRLVDIQQSPRGTLFLAYQRNGD